MTVKAWVYSILSKDQLKWTSQILNLAKVYSVKGNFALNFIVKIEEARDRNNNVNSQMNKIETQYSE